MSYIGHITPLLDNIANQILFGDSDGTVLQDPKFFVNPVTGQLFFAGYDGTLTGPGTSYAMFTNSGAVVQDTDLITGTDLFDFEDDGVPSSFTVQVGDTVAITSADATITIDASVAGTIDLSAASSEQHFFNTDLTQTDPLRTHDQGGNSVVWNGIGDITLTGNTGQVMFYMSDATPRMESEVTDGVTTLEMYMDTTQANQFRQRGVNGTDSTNLLQTVNGALTRTWIQTSDGTNTTTFYNQADTSRWIWTDGTDDNRVEIDSVKVAFVSTLGAGPATSISSNGTVAFLDWVNAGASTEVQANGSNVLLNSDNGAGNEATIGLNLATGNIRFDSSGSYYYFGDGIGGNIPTVNALDDALVLDTANGRIHIRDIGAAFTALQNIVEDTSPQLGGDLDANGSDILNVPMMDFDTAAGITVTQGQLAWNADEETLDLGQTGAILQIGQEIHYHVRNITGVQIDDGTPVMSTGTIGGSSRITVAPMNNDGSIDSFYFMGIATEDIADSSDGKVTHFGKVRGIQTDGVNYGEAWIDGDLIYLDPAAPGDLTKTRPTQNSHKDPIAIVINSHASNGTLFVRASTGHGIQHASDVYEQSVTAGELLVRDATNNWWENQTLAEAGILGNVVEDTTPQLGGDLDMNGNQITSPDGTDLIDIPDGSIDLQTNSLSRLDITDAGVRLGAANARVTTVLDEDNMASDSATALATQQSIKAYIDGFGYIANLSEDATPQLGGVLDVNGNRLGSPDGTDGVDIINGSLDVQTNSLSRLDVTDSGVRLGAANARVTTILDEDAMGSDSDTSLATQQSIKAYIDNSLGARPVMKSYTFSSTAGSGEFYLAGYYDAPLADANLSQASTTQTLGNANVPYAAHAFLVAGGAGTASGGAGAVIITVTGTSITDAGVRTPADSQTIVADITTMGLNDYYETSKKWIGQVTYTLDVGATGHTAYAADFNYGWCKYEDFGNRDFTITDVEAVGLAGANDTSFNIDLLLHSDAGWTYSAAAFSPGGTSIEDMNSDHVTEIDLDNGEPFAWKRAALAQAVSGSASEGVVVKITTGAAGAVEYMDLHLGVTI